MAKKRSEEPIFDEMELEEVIEEPIVNEEVVEAADNSLDKFIDTQLEIINRMSDTAKARRLAARVLRNRKGK